MGKSAALGPNICSQKVLISGGKAMMVWNGPVDAGEGVRDVLRIIRSVAPLIVAPRDAA